MSAARAPCRRGRRARLRAESRTGLHRRRPLVPVRNRGRVVSDPRLRQKDEEESPHHRRGRRRVHRAVAEGQARQADVVRSRLEGISLGDGETLRSQADHEMGREEGNVRLRKDGFRALRRAGKRHGRGRSDALDGARRGVEVRSGVGLRRSRRVPSRRDAPARREVRTSAAGRAHVPLGAPRRKDFRHRRGRGDDGLGISLRRAEAEAGRDVLHARALHPRAAHKGARTHGGGDTRRISEGVPSGRKEDQGGRVLPRLHDSNGLARQERKRALRRGRVRVRPTARRRNGILGHLRDGSRRAVRRVCRRRVLDDGAEVSGVVCLQGVGRAASRQRASAERRWRVP